MCSHLNGAVNESITSERHRSGSAGTSTLPMAVHTVSMDAITHAKQHPQEHGLETTVNCGKKQARATPSMHAERAERAQLRENEQSKEQQMSAQIEKVYDRLRDLDDLYSWQCGDAKEHVPPESRKGLRRSLVHARCR